MELNPRMEEVLFTLVRHYIESGGPVSSKTVLKQSSLNLSPATVRNLLALLDAKGYLMQPHTSAGRVPTDMGYRAYVNHLMGCSGLSAEDASRIDHRYGSSSAGKVLGTLLQETSQILSEFSHSIGLVLAPKMTNVRYNHMKFIRMGDYEILAVLVSQAGILQSRVIRSDSGLSQEELDELTQVLNRELCGLTLEEVRRRIVRKMEDDMRVYRAILRKVFLMSEISEPEELQNQLYLEGAPKLLEHPEFAKNIERMKTIFQAFTKKSNLVRLLDRSIDADGVLVFIGSENRHRMLEDCSVVTASYKCNDRVVGTLGVIGPKRMDYSKVIPVVDYTSKLLSRFIH